MSEVPQLPDSLTLPALQRYVRAIVAARGFTTELDRVFILTVEELGELATELKKRRFYPERFDPAELGFEIADLLLYLADLANGFEVDLMAHWPRHEAENDRRFAQRRGGKPAAAVDPAFTLNRLRDHLEVKRQERGFEDQPDTLMTLLTEEIGEIATEIRKRWKGLEEPRRAAFEIVDALTYLLRLAHWFSVDVEAAVRTKEALNAKRDWRY